MSTECSHHAPQGIHANYTPLSAPRVPLPTDKELVLKVVPMPADCNPNGDILSFFSSVSRIGTTSITVQVEVYAERYTTQGQYIKVTEASITYVAIDHEGKPRPIPKPTQPVE